jgi:hypothetical protein
MKLRLTDTCIEKAKIKAKPYKLIDGAGLYLEVRPKGEKSRGAKLWRYRYRIGDKENVFAAGEYVDAPVGETTQDTARRIASGRMTLAEARVERAAWRALVKQAHHRKTEKLRRAGENANTFEAVAREWMAKYAARWSVHYAGQVPGDRRVPQDRSATDPLCYFGASSPDRAKGREPRSADNSNSDPAVVLTDLSIRRCHSARRK